MKRRSWVLAECLDFISKSVRMLWKKLGNATVKTAFLKHPSEAGMQNRLEEEEKKQSSCTH